MSEAIVHIDLLRSRQIVRRVEEAAKALQHERERDREYGVYFVGMPRHNLVKIGFSADFSRPFGQLRRLAPNEHLVVLGRIRGDRKTEQQLHARFASARVMNEWFELTEEIDVWMQQHVLAYRHLSRSSMRLEPLNQ
jgi:hypothetical protein